MTLKTGRRCTWDEIEVGEVFAWNGCWVIALKTLINNAMILERDERGNHGCHDSGDFTGDFFVDISLQAVFGLYKLPKSVQSLWKCE